jgi:hypothetical protein
MEPTGIEPARATNVFEGLSNELLDPLTTGLESVYANMIDRARSLPALTTPDGMATLTASHLDAWSGA